MLTRLMFGGGGTAQVLIMQAERSNGKYSYYGYKLSYYGSLSPNFILSSRVTYEIRSFETNVDGPYVVGRTSLSFKDNKRPEGNRIIIEVNGNVYTLTYDNDLNKYYVDAKIFTSTSTYIIKILSIE